MKYYLLALALFFSMKSWGVDSFQAEAKCEQAYEKISNSSIFRIPNYKNQNHDAFMVYQQTLLEDPEHKKADDLFVDLLVYDKGTFLKIPVGSLRYGAGKVTYVDQQNVSHCIRYTLRYLMGHSIDNISDSKCSDGPSVQAVPLSAGEVNKAQATLQAAIVQDVYQSTFELSQPPVVSAYPDNAMTNLARSIYSFDTSVCACMPAAKKSLDGLVAFVKQHYSSNGSLIHQVQQAPAKSGGGADSN